METPYKPPLRSMLRIGAVSDEELNLDVELRRSAT
jgi:hypothetical protein